MKICIIEPFFSGSHRAWATGYQQHSQHDIQLFTLPGRHWKWRMHGAAISLAKQFLEVGQDFDLIVASDLLDLTVFSALTRRKTHTTPLAMYFHENQMTYPWSPTDPDVVLKRDNHYAFIQYSSALTADYIFFNSNYHQSSFLDALPDFLQQFPDHRTTEFIPSVRAKSSLLSLGLDLSQLDQYRTERPEGSPILLWNHRWEYDKQPKLFFHSLIKLKEEGIDFRLIVLGESYSTIPEIFKKAQQSLADRLLHFGYAPSRADYARLLWQADILPVTSIQDFFGGSIVEAMYCQCQPLLPNRLAYPEHIPDELHPLFLYENDDHFYSRLKEAIVQYGSTDQPIEFTPLVKKYNWLNLAPEYDRVFASSISKTTI